MHRYYRAGLASLLFLIVCSQSWADDNAIPIADKQACMQGPLAEFGQYIGNWDIADSSLDKDGQGWSDGEGARWNFVCIGNGIAVQDFWLPANGNVGTNLRTYNSDTSSWDIAWTMTGMKGFAHIQAKKNSDGNIVMHYKSPLPDPLRRITFFPPDANGWNWKLEVSIDNGENWKEVYRIKATPSKLSR